MAPADKSKMESKSDAEGRTIRSMEARSNMKFEDVRGTTASAENFGVLSVDDTADVEELWVDELTAIAKAMTISELAFIQSRIRKGREAIKKGSKFKIVMGSKDFLLTKKNQGDKVEPGEITLKRLSYISSACVLMKAFKQENGFFTVYDDSKKVDISKVSNPLGKSHGFDEKSIYHWFDIQGSDILAKTNPAIAVAISIWRGKNRSEIYKSASSKSNIPDDLEIIGSTLASITSVTDAKEFLINNMEEIKNHYKKISEEWVQRNRGRQLVNELLLDEELKKLLKGNI